MGKFNPTSTMGLAGACFTFCTAVLFGFQKPKAQEAQPQAAPQQDTTHQVINHLYDKARFSATGNQITLSGIDKEKKKRHATCTLTDDSSTCDFALMINHISPIYGGKQDLVVDLVSNGEDEIHYLYPVSLSINELQKMLGEPDIMIPRGKAPYLGYLKYANLTYSQ